MASLEKLVAADSRNFQASAAAIPFVRADLLAWSTQRAALISLSPGRPNYISPCPH